MRKLLFVMSLIVISAPACADTIYKCVDAGKTTYSGSPCEGTPAKELQVTRDSAANAQAQAKRNAYAQQLQASADVWRQRREAEESAALKAASLDRTTQSAAAIQASAPAGDQYAQNRANEIAQGFNFNPRSGKTCRDVTGTAINCF
jgi:hypothetical protein